MSRNLSDQMNIVPNVSACLDVVTYKQCSGCNLEKSLSEFGKKGERKDGVVRTEARCKECRRKYFKSRYKEKTEPQRSKRMKDKEIANVRLVFLDKSQHLPIEAVVQWIQKAESK